MSKKDDIDWAVVTEMQKDLERFEKEKLERVRVFDPKQILKQATEIRELVDEDLGVIRYCVLSYNQLQEIIEKCKENKDRSIQLLFHMLKPANDLALDDVKALPYEVVVRLLQKLTKEGGFFPQKQSKNGSTPTEELKQSGT